MTTAQMMSVSNLLPPLALPLETKWRKLLKIFQTDDGRPHGDALTATQVLIIDTIARRRYSRVQLILPTQYGKLVADHVPVFTKSGWKEHGQLVVGDYVLGGHGNWVRVKHIMPKQLANMRVKLTNGEVIDVHENHEWTVYNKSVGKLMTLETKQMLRYNAYARPQLMLPRMALKQHAEVAAVDPYFLGYWLGDGISRKPSIVVHPKDKAALDSLDEQPSSINTHKQTGVLLYNFYKTSLYQNMKALGVMGNKHIPQSYKAAGLQTKLQLLAGLIDSDGHVWNSQQPQRFDRRITIANINKRLVDDIADLLHSIDVRISITKVAPTTSSGGIVGKSPVYYLSFVSQYDIPTRIPRKRIEPSRIKRRIGIASVAYIQPTPGNCITVDAPDGLYRVGKTMQPTHNSLAVADGVLLRIATHNEKWAIIAPSEDKARIIMDYIIDRIFDDSLFSAQLEYSSTKEKLKQERSKTRITFRDGGEVRVYSGNASNTRQVKSALMGFGAPNIILDEAGQISDELYATVKRMVGGAEGTPGGSFLLEIGNPVFRNHFYRTWFGDRYKKIFVNDEMALREGRYTTQFLAEMQQEAGYDWMYRCLFPEQEEVLPSGYRRLLSDLVIDDAMINVMPELRYKHDSQGNVLTNKWGHQIVDDEIILGIDPAGGGANKTKLVLRFPGHHLAMVAKTLDTEDLDIVADAAEVLIREWNVGDWRTVVDAGGVGHGLPAIMLKRGYLVKAVHFGEKEVRSKDTIVFKIPHGFLNIRAWMYWEARKWLNKEGGRLLRDDGFLELKLINYRQNSSLNTQIEPKEEMIRRKARDGEKVLSPDTADAFVLTFVDVSHITDEDDIYVD